MVDRHKGNMTMSKKTIRPTLPALRRINEILLRLSIAAAPLMAFIAIMPDSTRWR